MKTLIIIPCYNEELNLKATVKNLRAKAPTVEFVVIDDGSQDDTHKVCVDNNYPVISFPFNMGLASAIQAGMCHAFNNGYDMALQFDGDGQHLPEYISDMVKLMQDSHADIVIGSRYIQKPLKGMRGLGSAIIRVALKIATRKTLTDPTSGMRLYNREMIDRFANYMNYGPEPDTLAYLINRGAKVLEMPVTMQERKAGKSYLFGFASISYMLRMFTSILIIQWFRGGERNACTT